MADSTFMKKMRKTANTLITRFGVVCRVQTVDAVEYTAKIVFLTGEKSDGDSTMVQDFDRRAFMSDTAIQPKSGDFVFVGDDVWSVVRSSEYTPSNGMNICWKLDLKA